MEKEFIKDIDYTIKDGRITLTKKYLIEQKACCGGTCELCPYTEKVKGNTELK